MGLVFVLLTLESKSLSIISLKIQPTVLIKNVPETKITMYFISGNTGLVAANNAHKVGHKIIRIGIGLLSLIKYQ
jgi:hypothetical protein